MYSACDLPVLLLLWRRPETTRRLLEALRPIAPSRLFVACDGPRPQDAEAVARTRELVASMVDWPCTVERRYNDRNAGCRDGVSGALDWFFGQVESGIVLEDDCIPHPDFFRFCAAVLQRHADDDQVWVVTGDNFQRGRQRGDAAYYYSRYPHCWGWASWSRAWRHFDPSLSFWPAWRRSADWRKLLPDRVERAYWSDIFERVFQGRLGTSWAYPWTACVWYHGGLTATPNVNLVTNIGFGEDATHTVAAVTHGADPTQALGAITHPRRIAIDVEADRFTFEHHFGGADRRFPRILWAWPRAAAGRLAHAVGVSR